LRECIGVAEQTTESAEAPKQRAIEIARSGQRRKGFLIA
jgi:AMMECR1 domain-containing protein